MFSTVNHKNAAAAFVPHLDSTTFSSPTTACSRAPRSMLSCVWSLCSGAESGLQEQHVTLCYCQSFSLLASPTLICRVRFMWLSPCTWAKVPLLLSRSIPVIHLSVFSPFYKGSTRVKESLPACSVDSEEVWGKLVLHRSTRSGVL